jgi:hypothetical protein
MPPEQWLSLERTVTLIRLVTLQIDTPDLLSSEIQDALFQLFRVQIVQTFRITFDQRSCRFLKRNRWRSLAALLSHGYLYLPF